MVIKGYVYDLSKFIGLHPGGMKAIEDVAGEDASGQFDLFHSIKILPK